MTGESEFLDAYDASDFPRPSVAVDVALVTVAEEKLAVLLVRRKEHPHRGAWQLPGGFVGIDESLDDAAKRVLLDKTGISGVFTEQLYTFGDVDRDPRTRVISVAYYSLVGAGRLGNLHDDGALVPILVPWSGETGGAVDLRGPDGLIDVAFDHRLIVGTVVKRLRGKLGYAPIGYELLPGEFTLHQLQAIHETISGARLNKDSFRRRMLASGELVSTGRRQQNVGHRPATLYRYEPA